MWKPNFRRFPPAGSASLKDVAGSRRALSGPPILPRLHHGHGFFAGDGGMFDELDQASIPVRPSSSRAGANTFASKTSARRCARSWSGNAGSGHVGPRHGPGRGP